MNRFHHVRIKLESFLNNLSLKKKLRYLYFLCILVPIFLTDIVILHALTKNEHAEQLHQMEKIAKSVQSMLSAATEDSALISTSLYMDNSLQDFVSRNMPVPRTIFQVTENTSTILCCRVFPGSQILSYGCMQTMKP